MSNESFEQSAQEQDMNAINLTIEQAQFSVTLANALTRLESNPDFRTVILNDYMREQPVRLGHLLSAPEMQSKSSQKAVIAELKSIGDFVSYLRNTQRRGQMASEAIRVNEEELQSIYAANPETTAQPDS